MAPWCHADPTYGIMPWALLWEVVVADAIKNEYQPGLVQENN
jgi:hypothetical protein